MRQKLKAVYKKGIFIPIEPCDVPEGSEVELIVQDPILLPPEATEPEERMSMLKGIIERMRQNPIPTGAPQLTREDLHERR